MTTPDEHLNVLWEMLRDANKGAEFCNQDDRLKVLADGYRARAAAIHWILNLNAFGMTEDEVIG